MAVSKRKRSSLKRIRQNARRRGQGKAVRSMLRTVVKGAREATGDASDALKAAQSALDRAAARGTIHRNQAARRKARLAKASAKR